MSESDRAMADHSSGNQPAPPPYPYQEQPTRSGDYAPYPQFSQEQRDQQDQIYGTPVMGAPSSPGAHPDNRHAADGSLSSHSESGHDSVNACKTQAFPSVPGQAPESPYVQAAPSTATKGSREQLRVQVEQFSKKAEAMMSNVWGHLSTGGSMTDNAWGRVTAGTQLLTKGGFEGVFKSTFSVDADERLKKTYACFLSTSTGPVGGTLFISTKKLAFCSDRPLSYTHANGQQAFSYYKVIIPVAKVKEVAPSSNQNKPAEKYIQVVTTDNFEFWFMGFVNYDKGVKNLQAILTGDAPTNDATHQATAGHASEYQYQGSYQETYPPNQSSTQNTYPPNQYGTVPPKYDS